MPGSSRAVRAAPPGRERIFQVLVPELLSCPKGQRHRDLPLSLLLGPRGSGKTYVLKQLEGAYGGTVPSAYLDLENTQREQARGILVELAFKLSRKTEQFVRVRFPLLTMCLFAAGSPIDMDDDPGVRRVQMETALHDRLQRGHRLARRAPDITDVAILLRQVAELSRWFDIAVSLLMRGLGVAGRKRLLRSWHRWWKDLYPGAPADAIDAMIDINQMWRTDPKGPGVIDQILFDAFVEDLYRSFSGLVTSYDRRLKYLAMLDNIHSAGGRCFVDLLVKACHYRKVDDQPSPLVVMATSRQRVPETVDNQPGGQVRAVEQVSYQDWSRCRDKAHRQLRSWWYPIALRDLTRSELAMMAHQRGQRDWRTLPEYLHWFTHGHPATASVVMEPITRPVGQEGLLARDVLLRPSTRTDHGEPRSTVIDRALDDWLVDADSDLRRNLIATAALDISSVPTAEALDISVINAERLKEAITENHWEVDPAFGLRPYLTGLVDDVRALGEQYVRNRLGGYPVLHPLLRRLLQHRLASGDHDDYHAAHERLADYHVQLNENVQHAHHQLALGRIDAAVEYLVARFEDLAPTGSLRQWLLEVYLVTQAPNDHKEWGTLSSAELYEKLIPWSRSQRPLATIVGELVPALWILADPIGYPIRIDSAEEILQTRVGDCFSELAPLTMRPGDRRLLHDMARRYAKCPLPWLLGDEYGRAL